MVIILGLMPTLGCHAGSYGCMICFSLRPPPSRPHYLHERDLRYNRKSLRVTFLALRARPVNKNVLPRHRSSSTPVFLSLSLSPRFPLSPAPGNNFDFECAGVNGLFLCGGVHINFVPGGRGLGMGPYKAHSYRLWRIIDPIPLFDGG